MLCKNCSYFKIKYGPYLGKGEIYDTGLAVCEKHDLVIDWLSKRQLNRLKCVEKEQHEESAC